MVELLYALNTEGRLVHIDSVANGLACECCCPGCGTPLVAKNNGETMTPHFAHYKDACCNAAHESELHLLAKEIISDRKTVWLPCYGTVFKGAVQHFDSVEVEERYDIPYLQPDLCGVTRGADGAEHRLWIEIKVTHPIGEDKREVIIRNKISCIEIDLSKFMDRQVTRAELECYLLLQDDGHEWTNNPILEQRQQAFVAGQRNKARNIHHAPSLNVNDAYSFRQQVLVMERDYMKEHDDQWVLESTNCLVCRHHTTRKVIFDEVKQRRLPQWLKTALNCNLQWLKHNNMNDMLEYRDDCYTFIHEKFVKMLPTKSPDCRGNIVSDREIRSNRKVIPFLLNVIPELIDANGLHCKHNRHSFPTQSNKYDIACDCPKVVNKHRKKY